MPPPTSDNVTPLPSRRALGGRVLPPRSILVPDDSTLRPRLEPMAWCATATATGMVKDTPSGPAPVLVLRFTHVDGTELPTAVLRMSAGSLLAFARQVTIATARALAKSAEARWSR